MLFWGWQKNLHWNITRKRRLQGNAGWNQQFVPNTKVYCHMKSYLLLHESVHVYMAAHAIETIKKIRFWVARTSCIQFIFCPFWLSSLSNIQHPLQNHQFAIRKKSRARCLNGCTIKLETFSNGISKFVDYSKCIECKEKNYVIVESQLLF